MHLLTQDLRYAFRQWAKSPGFALVCVLTIALGIGANTAIFSVMNTVLLRFLPVPNPQQLVYLHLKNQPLATPQTGYGDISLSRPVYEQMRVQPRVFSDVIALVPLAFGKVAVRLGAEPEQANGEMVSGNFFSGLRVRLALGRGFTTADEVNHASIAVLNYAWWTRQFAQDPGVLSHTLYVKGLPFLIVGVAPPGFNGSDPGTAMDFWVPLQNRPELNAWGTSATEATLYGSPNWLCLIVVGRLRPEVTWPEAIAQLTPVFQRAIYTGVTSRDPKEPKPQLFFSSVRGVENLREDYEQPLRFLMGMVTLVLVIACSDVAMLLIARNSNRTREFGLRLALGASRRNLFGQLLTESILLVTFGAAIGWIFAVSASQALSAWSGLDIGISPDRNVLLFTLLAALLVALVFGVAPLRTATRVPMSVALKTGAGTLNTDRSQYSARKLVLAMQISLCFVLLVAAGLLFRTLRNLESRNLGMRTEGLLVFGIDPQRNIHSDADAIRFHQRLLDRIRRLPGVDSATLTQVRIGSGGSNNDGVLVDGKSPAPTQGFAPMRVNLVGPRFLDVLRIPILRGRDIAETDTPSSQKVAIVNQTFANRYLPKVDPLGHHIAYFHEKSQYTIVGLAANSRYQGIREPDHPMAYFPYTQATGISGMQYEVHTLGDPNTLVPVITRLVRDIDPNLPLEKPMTQKAQFEQSVSQERLTANLSTFFGLLAALLVAVGLYGTLAYNVSRRTTEIGVRMALGAQRVEILGMVARETLIVAAIGLAVGLPASLLVARMLRSTLYGLSPIDPITFTLAFIGIATVTLAASYIPARHAASVDPLTSLRAE
ncbi:MAG: ABC transporter permease [Bryobacteraceae bacterium]